MRLLSADHREFYFEGWTLALQTLTYTDADEP